MSGLGATIAGDRYQTRIFWYHAAQLLCDDSIEFIELESPDTTVFDDIILHYTGGKGRWERGQRLMHDYFQIKYHVDARGALNAEGFINPAVNKTKQSMLARFFGVYKKFEAPSAGARLNLVTNWGWHPDDDLAKCWRHACFAPEQIDLLPKKCTAIQDWATHLGCDKTELKSFLANLKIHSGWADHDQLQIMMNDRFHRAGLKPVDLSAGTSPYDDLGLQFIERRQSKFDRNSLLKECEAAGLVAGEATKMDFGRMITISSMSPPAPIGDGAAAVIDLKDCFSSKRLAHESSWNGVIRPRLEADLADTARGLSQPLLLMPDCHSSVAIAAGRIISPKKGHVVDVLQSGRAGTEIWKSSDGKGAPEIPWKVERPISFKSPNLVVSVSISRLIHKDVENFISGTGLKSDVLRLTSDPVGQSAIRGSSHAWGLAESLANTIRDILREYKVSPKLHFFYAGPNALAVRIGQESQILGEMQLYEFDFEGVHKYTSSIFLPR